MPMTTGWLPAIIVTVASFALSCLAVRLALVWLRKRALLDRPNARSSHVTPTPRGGGLGLIPVVLLVWVGATIGAADWRMASVLAGAALLFLVSFRDDVKSLPPGPRLLAQFLAALFALPWLLSVGPVFQGVLPPILDAVLVVLSLVGFVNFFNFMDGIDGISGVEGGSIGLGAGLVMLIATGAGLPLAAAGMAMPLGFCLFGGALGFLIWNWHPARVFLGDVGSVPLGYLSGLLCLILAGEGLWVPALLLPAYYMADAGLTLLARAWRRERLTEAHRSHFYQRALRGGLTHARVSGAVLLCQGLLVGAACLSLRYPWLALGAGILAVLCLLVWLQHHSRMRVSG